MEPIPTAPVDTPEPSATDERERRSEKLRTNTRLERAIGPLTTNRPACIRTNTGRGVCVMSKHNADVANKSSMSSSIDREELFQLVKRSDMNVTEVEREDSAVVELSVLWQTSILRVVHLDGARTFSVATTGTDSDDRMVLDESMLSSDLSIVSRSNGASFCVANNATGELEINGRKLSMADAAAEGLATQRSDGGFDVALREGVRCKMVLGGLTFSARSVAAGRKVAGRTRRDPALIASAMGAFALIGSLVGAGYLSSSQSSLLSAENGEDRLADIAAMMNRARERSPEQVQQPTDSSVNAESAQGAAARGEQGLSGRRDSAARNGRIAVQNRGQLPQLARPMNAREQVSQRGIFAALGATPMQSASSGPVSPFGGMISSGSDARDAWGNLSGDSIGDAFGFNGLGNTGTGFGAGGNGDGTVCTGDCGFSTVGIGGRPDGDRFGSTQAQRLGPRGPRGPLARPMPPEVGGEYNRDIVRRVVQRNIGQVTRCHEQGLSQNQGLAGRVVVTFIIGATGNVLGSSVRESNLAVPSVAQCIANAARTWQFTATQGNTVTVHYPFLLQPAE